MSEALKDRKGMPSNKRPDYNKGKGLSKKAKERLTGLSQALEAPSTPPIYFASPKLSEKPSNYEKNRLLLIRLSNFRIQIRNQIRAKKAAEDLETYASR
jgi:hypothetical protein